MADAAEPDRIEGLRLLQRYDSLLVRLRGEGCARDRAGNRTLFFDHACALILLTFFNPSITSLRDLQRASRLASVRRKLGCSRTSLGSLSESLRVFDPERLVEIIQELLGKIPDASRASGSAASLRQLKQIPTAVDGTLLRQLPQITQACYATRTDRGWKLHTHFEVLRGVPVRAQVTDASGQGAANEKAVLRSSLESDRCYITDRGYEDFSLFNAIVAAGSSYVCRVRNDHHFRVNSDAQAGRALSAEAQAAGVLSDELGRMGSEKSRRIEHPDHLQRRIVIQFVEHPKRGGRRRQGATQEIVLVTNLRDVPAEIIVLLYRFRWLIELFFRWLKCVLGCRHLISESARGIEIQMYCALIACLLIQLACPFKPNQWTYKLLCLYQQGWVTEEELLAHIQERAALLTN
jgi:hypothetical protein